MNARLIVAKTVCLTALVLLSACSSGPPVPDWQLESKAAIERSLAAYLQGNNRIDALEFERARRDVASTGRADLVARIELLRCAGQVASLVFTPCTGFERLRQDAADPERAYADYLTGQLRRQDLKLLPASQQPAAAAGADVTAVNKVVDPLSRLVAAGVMMQSGRASPALLQLAVDTASAQGWRRPLLAWLGAQLILAEKGGNPVEAERLRRRITLTENSVAGSRP
jgi:hypothetical protein